MNRDTVLLYRGFAKLCVERLLIKLMTVDHSYSVKAKTCNMLCGSSSMILLQPCKKIDFDHNIFNFI